MKFWLSRSIAAAALIAINIGLLALPSADAQVPVGKIVEYPINITPAATAAAIGTTEQTFTVTGLTTDDIVFVNSKAAPTALCPLVGARASAANTVSLQFSTLTAVACTPVAGFYMVMAVR